MYFFLKCMGLHLNHVQVFIPNSAKIVRHSVVPLKEFHSNWVKHFPNVTLYELRTGQETIFASWKNV